MRGVTQGWSGVKLSLRNFIAVLCNVKWNIIHRAAAACFQTLTYESAGESVGMYHVVRHENKNKSSHAMYHGWCQMMHAKLEQYHRGRVAIVLPGPLQVLRCSNDSQNAWLEKSP